jgi:hypothetical protein
VNTCVSILQNAEGYLEESIFVDANPVNKMKTAWPCQLATQVCNVFPRLLKNPGIPKPDRERFEKQFAACRVWLSEFGKAGEVDGARSS